MSISARITPTWKKQKLFVSIFLLLFGAYFFLDGAVVWPRSNERYLKHKEFIERDDLAGWNEYAANRGWQTAPPEKLHTSADIAGQFLFGSICVAGGIVALAYWSVQIRRSIRLEGETIFSPEGKRIPVEAITGLGLKRWESKGLATVRYELGGRRREFVIDDYKFEAEPCRTIVDELKRLLEARAKLNAQS
jgi:hypothetical protein